ncbi:MAG: DNA polymerase III subunit gamma/tau, partial [Bacteroidales bacterium]
MENFIVSARKYRPVTFDTVVGQKSITSTLKNAIKNNHLAQAFLFCGQRGVGKTTCARILAKTINCENLSLNIEACNTCNPCQSFNTSHSFNVFELDAASNNSVDDIRNLVDQVRIPPQIGKYKIYIIDEVHMLSPSAFNAFLKTLEEPPDYAKFILATTEKHKIIPTILSRCQIFDFNRITIDDISKHLAFVANSEHVVAEPDALQIIAQKADGALRDALSIFDQIVSFAGDEGITYKAVIENLNVLDYDYFFNVNDFLLQGNIPETLLLLNDVFEHGFDGHHFINGLGEHFRNLLVCKDASTIKLLEVGENIRYRYSEQAQSCTAVFLLKALDLISKCDVNYKTTNNKRLLIELTLMQICSLSSQSNPFKEAPNAELIKPVSKVITTPVKPQPPEEKKLTEVKHEIKPDNIVAEPILPTGRQVVKPAGKKIITGTKSIIETLAETDV